MNNTESSVDKLQHLLDNYKLIQQKCTQIETQIRQEETSINISEKTLLKLRKEVESLDETRHQLRQVRIIQLIDRQVNTKYFK